MVGGLGVGDGDEREEAEWGEVRGDVYFRGRPCTVHLKIGFVDFNREKQEKEERDRERGRVK